MKISVLFTLCTVLLFLLYLGGDVDDAYEEWLSSSDTGEQQTDSPEDGTEVTDEAVRTDGDMDDGSDRASESDNESLDSDERVSDGAEKVMPCPGNDSAPRRHSDDVEAETAATVPTVFRPIPCIPDVKRGAIVVVPVTDVEFRLGRKRTIWSPTGAATGIARGQVLRVCRDIGRSHLHAVADVRVVSVWKNNLMARPLERFNPYTDDGAGIRKGDVLLFNELPVDDDGFTDRERKLIRRQKRLRKRVRHLERHTTCRSPKRVKREKGYDRVIYPEFSGELIRFDTDADLAEKIRKKEREQKKNADEGKADGIKTQQDTVKQNNGG